MAKHKKQVENWCFMYPNVRRHMAAQGSQSMFLPTPYGGASIEWVKGSLVIGFI